jgi:hypothetical protein
MRTPLSSMNTSPLTLLTCGQPGWNASSASCTLKNRLMLRGIFGTVVQRALVLEET